MKIGFPLGRNASLKVIVAVPLPIRSTLKVGGWKLQSPGQKSRLPEKEKGLVNVRSDTMFGIMIVGPVKINVPPKPPPRPLVPAKKPKTLIASPGAHGKQC